MSSTADYLPIVAGFVVMPTCIAAMVTHVVVCVSTNWAALLIVGLVFPPVGIIHGIGIWLGGW